MYISTHTHKAMCIILLPKFMNNKARYIHPHVRVSVLRSLITFKFEAILALCEVLLNGFGSILELVYKIKFRKLSFIIRI